MQECPNCVTPWKCNGPHINFEKDGHYSCELGDFFRICNQLWEFVPNQRSFDLDSLMAIADVLEYLQFNNNLT